ncbi:GGDEF domain-containing protein [Noviherbaspirillum suwonense]|jgi:diguanylate cyclase (GGDEF)-like protein|uniref:diguanylate cyclase n=1 Tax=Noviherbaspirillum suwonense TaxID=1224511 RepID=A0ABY1Q1X1_9BURK|nr:GGDEF domain-containing protein [Noviherbaspirillum suwonense]SMP53387.1 diguanylate cyclase (GGDEF) domain-containing protein [Noviherbaspirillum suwonense]
MLSPVTLLLITAALSVIMLLVLGSLMRSGIPGVRSWFAANVLAVLALLLYAGRGVLPPLLSVEAANGLLAMCIAVIYAGFQQFFQRPVPVRMLAVGWICTMAGVAGFHYLVDAIAMRTVAVSLFHGAVCAAIGVTILRCQAQAGSRYSYFFTAGVALLLAASHLGRGLMYALQSDMQTADYQTTAWNLFFLAVGTLVLPLLTMGGMMMVHDRMVVRAEEQANRDYLTGAWSRRALFQVADRELRRVARHRDPVSLLILDVDHFKQINDSHGHAEGDRVLVDLVLRASAIVREIDCFARLGGEEFALLLTHSDAAAALQVADRLRQVLEQPVPTAAAITGYTVSVGVATLQAGEQFSALLARADAALYQAKHAGRNRVRVAELA